MKLTLLTTIAALALSQVLASPIAEADPLAEAEAGAKQDSFCYQSCGRAMTEYNKCKGRGPNMHSCVCDEDSQFNNFYKQCVKCPAYIVNKFTHALSIPERECGISRN